MQGKVLSVAVDQVGEKGNGKEAGKNPMSGGDVFHAAKLPTLNGTKSCEMKEQLAKVQEFHETYGVPVSPKPTAALSEEEVQLRYKLLEEENSEYLEAALKGDLVEVADALGDALYILCGTMLSHGLQAEMEKVFAEIHRSNMSKLGSNGEPLYREDGKVIKGPNFTPPDLLSLLREHLPRERR